MRSAALLLLVLVVAGCGRTYSDAEVQHSLGAQPAAPLIVYGSRGFATSAAVTELRVSLPLPASVYLFHRYEVLRFRTRDSAWTSAHAGFASAYFGPGQIVVRHANLVLVGEAPAVRRALVRLRGAGG